METTVASESASAAQPSTETQPANSAPESPSLPGLAPASQNEPATETQTPLATPLAEKVGAVASRVFEKFGVPYNYRRGGKPRKDGLPNKNGILPGGARAPGVNVDSSPVAAVEPQAPAPVASAPPPDPAAIALFQRAIVGACKEVFGFLKGLIRIGADAADIDSGFTDKALKDCEPEPGAVEDFGESLRLVLKKRGIMTENAEEWALAINGARLVAPYLLLWQTFRSEIKRNRERKEGLRR